MRRCFSAGITEELLFGKFKTVRIINFLANVSIRCRDHPQGENEVSCKDVHFFPAT